MPIPYASRDSVVAFLATLAALGNQGKGTNVVTVLTGDSNPHVATTIPLPASPGITILEIAWIARDATTPGNSTAGVTFGAFRNNSGTAVQIGTAQDEAKQGNGGNGLTFSVTGSNANVLVTGNADNVSWTLNIIQYTAVI